MSDSPLKKRLDRFSSHLGDPRLEPVAKTTAPPRRCRYLADELGGEVKQTQGGAYCLVRTQCSEDHFHGRLRFGDLRLGDCLPGDAFSVESVGSVLPLEHMVFFDTETTGLGGAGAVAFLVGVGRWLGDRFELRQYLLPDYADEAGMLGDLQELFTDDSILVSYNGAAFDLPLINDRLVINRVARSLRHRTHVDLLHPTRRLFRRRLRDCSLVNVEEQLFGVRRTDDVPGYLIPSVFFEWTSTDQIGLLPQVLEHNRLDIVSLIFLLAWLAEVHASRGEVLTEADDIHSLSRLYGRRRENDDVRRLFDRLNQECGPQLPHDVIWFHSLNFKRLNQIDLAAKMWIDLAAGDSPQALPAAIELAKYYEHRANDLAAALRFTHQALAANSCSPRQRRHLQHRLERLKKRSGG